MIFMILITQVNFYANSSYSQYKYFEFHCFRNSFLRICPVGGPSLLSFVGFDRVYRSWKWHGISTASRYNWERKMIPKLIILTWELI